MNHLEALEGFFAACLPGTCKSGPADSYEAFEPVVDVPHIRRLLPKLRQWAELREVSMITDGYTKIRYRLASPPQITRFGVTLIWESALPGMEVIHTSRMAHPNEFVKNLLTGEWASTNGYEFRFRDGFRIPDFETLNCEEFVVRFPKLEVRRVGLFGRLFSAHLVSVTFGKDQGRVQIAGLLGRFVAPILVWSE